MVNRPPIDGHVGDAIHNWVNPTWFLLYSYFFEWNSYLAWLYPSTFHSPILNWLYPNQYIYNIIIRILSIVGKALYPMNIHECSLIHHNSPTISLCLFVKASILGQERDITAPLAHMTKRLIVYLFWMLQGTTREYDGTIISLNLGTL